MVLCMHVIKNQAIPLVYSCESCIPSCILPIKSNFVNWIWNYGKNLVIMNVAAQQLTGIVEESSVICKIPTPKYIGCQQ